MKKILSDKAFVVELIGFVFFQVLLDMYRVFFENTVDVFGIALPELLNFLYFGFLCLVFLCKHFRSPKKMIPLLVYAALIGVYSVLHVWNVLKFKQDILTGSEPNWFKELYFIARTYLVPVVVFYFFLCSKLTMRTFQKAVSGLSLVISANIVITNFFKVSFICYASTLEKNSFITRNIFEWFYNPDTEFPVYMTSKGWFYMGNQIGLILFMLFVFVVMNALQSGKVLSYVPVFLNGLALVMVGTKVSTLGCGIILALGFLFAVVFGVILKQFTFRFKQAAVYVLVVAVLLTTVGFSPMFTEQENRAESSVVTEEQSAVLDNFASNPDNPITQRPGRPTDPDEPDVLDPSGEQFKKEFCEYVKSAPYCFGVVPEFLELLPIEDNFAFWYDIVINGNNRQVDYRYFKGVLYDEVLWLNQNETADTLLGIGYISNFPYSERDFAAQIIWFGYAGTVLLIGPYILAVLYGIVLALKRIKSCFIYQNAFFAVGICTALALSYVAGHLFFGIFSITVFAFIAAAFYKFQTERCVD